MLVTFFSVAVEEGTGEILPAKLWWSWGSEKNLPMATRATILNAYSKKSDTVLSKGGSQVAL